MESKVFSVALKTCHITPVNVKNNWIYNNGRKTGSSLQLPLALSSIVHGKDLWERSNKTLGRSKFFIVMNVVIEE